MSYSISSKKFDHPLLKPILEKLTEYFFSIDVKFYVIEATARDIILSIHDEKSITQLSSLQASDLAVLKPGEAFLWATKASDKMITNKPQKIFTRPRVTKHGGGTIKATDNK